MLNKLRGFSNTKLAGVLITIIIIPFVFWGMGSVFSGGNTNNVAKINNQKISTQDFIEQINFSGLSVEVIKNNLENNIIEELLSKFVSEKLLDMEINNLNVSITDKSLVNKIKLSKEFMDDNNKFSRLKYEKFLLKNNLTAPEFESRLKQQELKKKLFSYISGGIKSPHFLKNKIYINETKKVELEYFNLSFAYNMNITKFEIEEFIKENEEKLKEDYINFSYAKISPKNLVGIEEFNEDFFKKIDEIENSILNGLSLNEIKKIYNFELISENNYKLENSSDETLKEIYKNRDNNNVQLIDRNNYFLLFKIDKVKKVLPNKSNTKFIKLVKDNIILKRKFDLHEEIFTKIQDKKITDSDFINYAKDVNNIKNITIKEITDIDMFDTSSIKLIYSIPEGSFTLVTDENNNIYLTKIKNISSNKLSKNDEKIENYGVKSNMNIINDIYGSYDLSLNKKYKVKIFQSTIDRVKNYFR